MAQGFYTLEEAAQRLGLAPHELNLMVQRREVRGFQDRGTWRFRTQDIDELARQRGQASDPDLQLGDSKLPADAAKPRDDASIFPFELDKGDEQDFGTDIFNVATEPKPLPGSDSDVRLVPAGSKLDLKAVEPTPRPPSKPSSSGKLVPDSDSDVKLVDMSGDDVVPIGNEDRPASDSDVRLEDSGLGKTHDSGVKIGRKADEPPTDDTLLIGEINLEPAPSRSGMRGPRSDKDSKKRETALADSSDIDLTPAAEKKPSSSLFDSSSEELTLDSSGELNVAKGPKSSAKQKADSGRKLATPADSDALIGGADSDEINFDLAVDESGHAGTTPKPGAQKPDSSSEFELTLDDEAGLAPLEEQSDTELLNTNLNFQPQVPDRGKKGGDSKLEPQLDDQGTDLESSDFELELEEDTATEGDEVIIDEDAGAADATAVQPMLDEGVEQLLDEETGLVIDEAAEEEDAEAAAQAALASIAAANAAPPSWGAWTLVHVPTTFFLIVAGLLLFEMMRSVAAYGEPNQPAAVVFDVAKDVAKKLGFI